MTNTLLKIADTKEKAARKFELVTLTFNKALEHRPHNPALEGKYNIEAERSYFLSFKEAFDGYKKLLTKIDKLEEKARLSGFDMTYAQEKDNIPHPPEEIEK